MSLLAGWVWTSRTRMVASLVVVALVTALAAAGTARAAGGCTDVWIAGSGAWSDPSDWSEGVVPGGNDVACITDPGTYTVTLTDFNGGQGATVAGVELGGSSGTQTLAVEGEGTVAGGDWYDDTTLGLGTSGMSIGANGVLDLESTANNTSVPPQGSPSGGSAQLVMTNGQPANVVDNAGTIDVTTTDPQWGALMNIQGTTANTGTIDVQSGSLAMTNEWTLTNTSTGAITVATGAEIEQQGIDFTNEGTVTNDGTILGYGQNTWVQSAGSVSGNAVQLGSDAQLTDAAGAGSFDFDYRGGGFLSGTIPAGQTVEVQGSTYYPAGEAVNNTELGLGSDASGSFVASTVTNDGTLILDAPGSDSTGGSANLYGGQLDSYGTVTSQAEDTNFTNTISDNLVNESSAQVSVATGTLNQQGSITNDGTFTVNAGATLALGSLGASTLTNAAGTFANPGTTTALGSGTTWNQSGGVETGSAVQFGGGAQLNDSAGTGSFAFDQSGGGYLYGTVPSGQTVTVTGSTFYSGGEAQTYTNLSFGSNATGAFVPSTVTNDGRLEVDSPGTDSTGGSTNLLGGELDNHGTFTATVEDANFRNAAFIPILNESGANTNVDSGVLFQGNDGTTNAGTVTIAPGANWIVQSGSFANSGTLTTQIASASSYGTLSLEGSPLTAGGELDPTLTGGYTPPASTEFEVIPLSGATVSGTFGSVASGFSVDYEPAYVGVIYNGAPAGVAPSFTSAASTTFTIATPGSLTITTTGTPAPALSDGAATLPAGVTFLDNGNGTATLSGTPDPGTGGTYQFTITASNGVSPNATQSFTLTVAPEVTSLAAAPQYVVSPPPAGVGLLKVSATLTAAGQPVSGQTVAFTVGKLTLCSAPTNSSGTATCSVPLLDELAVLLTNHYTASFAGTASYQASSASTKAIERGSGGAAAPGAGAAGGHGDPRIQVSRHVRHRRLTRLTVRIEVPGSRTLTRTLS